RSLICSKCPWARSCHACFEGGGCSDAPWPITLATNPGQRRDNAHELRRSRASPGPIRRPRAELRGNPGSSTAPGRMPALSHAVPLRGKCEATGPPGLQRVGPRILARADLRTTIRVIDWFFVEI